MALWCRVGQATRWKTRRRNQNADAASDGAETAEDQEESDGLVAEDQGAFSAAIADVDMECDRDRAWKAVEVSFRNAELVALQKARAEAEGAREHQLPRVSRSGPEPGIA